MKILKVLPKSCRKKIVLGELKRYRKSKWRKFTLKQRKAGIVISQAIQREAERTIAEAKKPTRSRAVRALAAYADNIALGDLNRAKGADERSRKFAGTKDQRNKLRRFWEVQK